MAEPAPPRNDPEVERAWREAPENVVAEIVRIRLDSLGPGVPAD